MNRPAYRDLAAKCLRVAEGVKNPRNKAVLLRIALTWHELARRREPAPANEAGQQDERDDPKA